MLWQEGPSNLYLARLNGFRRLGITKLFDCENVSFESGFRAIHL